jgi:hypothetical protein
LTRIRPGTLELTQNYAVLDVASARADSSNAFAGGACAAGIDTGLLELNTSRMETQDMPHSITVSFLEVGPVLRILAALLLVSAVAMFFVGCRTIPPIYPDTNPMTPPAATSQFDQKEAMAMIEFCVDLDNQDDRGAPGARHIYNVRSDRIADWQIVDDSRIRYADAIGLTGDARTNPSLNGFPPFDSAWTLWKNKEAEKRGESVYALAFRGTVFAEKPSVIEDALTTTVAAMHGMELPAGHYLNITYATLPRAEVHEGFAYGALSELFDLEYGALARIQAEVPPNSTLIITGHSQGAALATVAHAILYYAAKEGRFGIAEWHLKLRSYVFAQPRPGNIQFGMDFEGITAGGSSSFTINNTLDAVAMLPPTHSFLFGAFEDCPPGTNPAFELIRAVNNSMNRVSKTISGFSENTAAGRIARMQRKDRDHLFGRHDLWADGGFKPTSAVSQDYRAAGRVIPLIGLYNGSLYYGNPADAGDEFIQHHATSYRRLLETMFGYAATTESSPELAPPPVANIAGGKQ